MDAYIEKVIVIACKRGNNDAKEELFSLYQETLEKAHPFSKAGDIPIEEYRYEHYMVFEKAIEKYNFSKAGKKAELPFLNYLRNEVNYNDMDNARKKRKETARQVTFTELAAKKDLSETSYPDFADHLMNEAQMYDCEADALREDKIKDMAQKLIDDAADGSIERKFLEIVLDIARNQDANIMADAAKRLLGDDCKRTNMYYIRNKVLASIKPETKELILDLLRAA